MSSFPSMTVFLAARAIKNLEGKDMQIRKETLKSLAEERRTELLELAHVTERAIVILNESSEGILTNDLCAQLKKEFSTTQSVASSAVDYLRSSGRATKNWQTGLLTPTYK